MIEPLGLFIDAYLMDKLILKSLARKLEFLELSLSEGFIPKEEFSREIEKIQSQTLISNLRGVKYWSDGRRR